MLNTISSELYWLGLTTLLTSVMWIPYILNRMREQGIGEAIWDPQGFTATKSAWAERMMRAHENAIENLIIFTPLVLIIEINSLNSSLTATTCMIYFFIRIVHFVVFTFAIPVLRVVSFLVGFAAQITLALRLFQII